ncbi:MAG: prepilin-type N-terminal cleavage/methylation domain-containing protein [Acidimicrobiia bacterium]
MTRPARSLRDDDGFTLIEALVASLIAIIIMAAFAGSMTAAFRGSRLTHANQSATALGVEHLEFARSQVWVQLAMTYVPAESPHTGSGGTVLLAGEAGLTADETLVVSGSGAIRPLLYEGVDTTDYTVWQYVTDAGLGLRRVVVIITWQHGDATFTHRAATLIAEVSTR